LSGRGLCDELITRPEESYRLCCVVVCDLETSRMGAPYIYDISCLRVKALFFIWPPISEKALIFGRFLGLASLFFSGKCNMCVMVSMEHLWNDNNRLKPKYAEQNLHQFNLVQYRSHTG